MFYNAHHDLNPGAQISADICIIGSGAAGICLAHSLIGSGLKVILLESSCVNQRVPIERGKPAPEHRYIDPDAQQLYQGDLVGDMSELDPVFLTRSRTRCYGGSTNCWFGWTRPLSHADFDRSDLDPKFVWPISRDDLHDYYNLAIKYCSLGDWDVSAYDQPEYWFGKTRREITPMELRPNSPLQTGIVAAINSEGSSDGRLSFQAVWGPEIEHASNITIYRNANVRYLHTDAGNRSVRKLTASTIILGKAGHDFTVSANRYVLAAGGIETARLLLSSNGIGNRSDQLGRNFIVHPVTHNVDAFSRETMLSVPITNFCAGTAIIGCDWPPDVFASLVPTIDTLKREKIGNFGTRFTPEGFTFFWEQMPNSESRITLDSSGDLIFGDPQVKLDWRTTAFDMHTMLRGMQIVLDELFSLGYATTRTQNHVITQPGDHHMGATRMSKSPQDGVVNADCRLHDADNLFVASSSVFSTGGHANPTLTIIALALRLSNHLKRNR